MKIMKIKYLFLSLVLVFSLPGFAADPVAPSDGSETNVVILTQAQYAALTNDMGRLVSSFSNVVQLLQFSVDGSANSTNLLSNVRSSLDQLRTSISDLASLGTQSQQTFAVNADGSFTLNSTRYRNYNSWFFCLNKNLTSLGKLFHLFITGDLSASYDASYYNFITLIDGLSDLLDEVDIIARFVQQYLPDIYDDISLSRALLNDVRISLLDVVVPVLHAGTNQLQTIIYIISNRFDQVQTNTLDGSQFEVLTNYLDGISDGLSNISPGGGDPSAPGGGGGSSSVDFSYFDKWLKEWVGKYFYPADSDYTALYNDSGFLNPKYPSFGTPFYASFDVPYFAADENQYAADISSSDFFRMDRPYWGSAFNNTLEAFNSGHSNYYDIVSALLTDIQSVNAQNYALFYVLATNILLQSADADVSETQQDVDSLQEKIDSYQSDVETMKTDLEYKFNSLKSKYEDIKEKSDQIFSYLGGLARLPQQDYYFDLPKLQFGEDLEFGGMEIILPLTNQHLVMVAEILRFFSICLYWGLFISMLYFAARGVVKMFLLLFKFMIYMGAIGTDK